MELYNERALQELVSQISEAFFKKPFLDKVCFNRRLRTTGGRYLPGKRLIELNPKYYIEGDREEFIGIIKHELCHYHLHIEGKGYAHGDKAFKQLLKETDSPRFCKPLPSQQKDLFLYICKKCGWKYERKRRVNTNRYRCGKCKGELELSLNIAPPS